MKWKITKGCDQLATDYDIINREL